jgi:hypothetical protein
VYQVRLQIFHKLTLNSIKIPQAYIVANLLRDSLFARGSLFSRDSQESWADCFDVGGKLLHQGVAGAVAAGAAVVGAGAMVGLKIAEVALGA